MPITISQLAAFYEKHPEYEDKDDEDYVLSDANDDDDVSSGCYSWASEEDIAEINSRTPSSLAQPRVHKKEHAAKKSQTEQKVRVKPVSVSQNASNRKTKQSMSSKPSAKTETVSKTSAKTKTMSLENEKKGTKKR